MNVGPASSGRSVLYLLATSLGHQVDAARCLVKAAAGVDFWDYAGNCDVLFKAAKRGCGQLVNDLLGGGADPNILLSGR